MNADPADVKDRLALSVATIAEMFLPDGRAEGIEWRGHGPDGAAWGVVLRGRKVGCWQNFGAGTGGVSLLSFVRDVHCQGDHTRAWRWALDFIGDKIETPIARAPGPAPVRTPANGENGKGMWLKADAFAWAGPVGLYLQGRGIDPLRLARPPGALRFHAALWNAEHACHLPAMVAAIVDPISHQHIATHRTYLARGDDRWTKANVAKPKKVLGPFAGGIIPLTRGPSGKAWRQMAPGETLVLAEGIENALTVAMFYPEARAAAYVSASNLLNVDLPDTVAHVILVRDRDGLNVPLNDARGLAVGCWREEGREVSLWNPPAGEHDANDAWRAELAAELAAVRSQ